jgi:hypothetical protein
VALAVLGLLAEVAREQPLTCVSMTSTGWTRRSAQAFGFAALRLAADPIGLVFAKPVALPCALCRRWTRGHWRQTANRHARPVMRYAVATPGDTAKDGQAVCPGPTGSPTMG